MLPPLFVGGLGGPELVIVFLLVVLLFGANKLPKLARAGGEAMGEFQKGREQIEREIRDATSTESQRIDDEVEAAHDDRDDTAVDATESEADDDHDADTDALDADADTDALDAEREPGLDSSTNADRDIDADRDTDRNAPSA